MVNRRVGRCGRFAQKKKLKISKRLLDGSGTVATHDNEEYAASTDRQRQRNLQKKSSKKALQNSGKKTQHVQSLAKQRSAALKRQAAERMVLKEHVRELKIRRANIRKGDDAKSERRELGKYIRQIEADLKKKHDTELAQFSQQLSKGKKKAAMAGLDGVAGRSEEVSESQLMDMFAHLVA